VPGAHHRRQRLTSRPARVTAGAAGVAVLALAAIGTNYTLGRHRPASASPRTATSSVPAAPSGHSHRPATVPTNSLRVQAMIPAAGATDVAATAAISVTFSAPPAVSAPRPAIAPAVPGSWSQTGATLTFRPQGGWVPDSQVTVTVPAGVSGQPGHHTRPLPAAVSERFQIAPGSVGRLQQLLGELGYLPTQFAPSAPEATVASSVAISPVAGTWSWRYPNVPASLKALWTPGVNGVMTQGAVMAFEADHNLTTDGVAGPQVWGALLQAVAGHAATTRPYDYVMVSKASPETLYVWSGGRVVVSSLANTGVQGATTPTGTWPVYLRYKSTTMTGTDPNGTHYRDPGVPWVAYFYGGDAVHGFVRPGYGYPQSNGCVELPIPTAQTVWGLDPIGTLVTVS
jgi:peptidoglycan hydrolase-like protein with peptidoglycan-binding domain